MSCLSSISAYILAVNYSNHQPLTRYNYEEQYNRRTHSTQAGRQDRMVRSDHGTAYLQWCDDHGVEPDDNNAELYLEETESRIYDDGNEFADAFAEAIV